MKKSIIVALLLIATMGMTACAGDGTKTTSDAKVTYITKQQFLQLVADYESNPATWVFRGARPCIIDFTASWCGPCRAMSPILDELAAEYAGKIDIYKVDVDKEAELAADFGITAVPALLFCPLKGDPRGNVGALSKEELVNAIDTLLLPGSK